MQLQKRTELQPSRLSAARLRRATACTEFEKRRQKLNKADGDNASGTSKSSVNGTTSNGVTSLTSSKTGTPSRVNDHMEDLTQNSSAVNFLSGTNQDDSNGRGLNVDPAETENGVDENWLKTPLSTMIERMSEVVSGNTQIEQPSQEPANDSKVYFIASSFVSSSFDTLASALRRISITSGSRAATWRNSSGWPLASPAASYIFSAASMIDIKLPIRPMTRTASAPDIVGSW
ncbi:hypothetical protein BKA61DRAFT_682015 [Leptodontidium sp. MPI-SDFR-AT-0119]|nr:hypothetical protein BKA61DRAFT_682015 [Leptodontidium sp. MPI-SDFR-AT-0119]